MAGGGHGTQEGVGQDTYRTDLEHYLALQEVQPGNPLVSLFNLEQVVVQEKEQEQMLEQQLCVFASFDSAFRSCLLESKKS